MTMNMHGFFKGSSVAERLTCSGTPPSLTPRLWLEVPQHFSRRASTGLTLLQAPALL